MSDTAHGPGWWLAADGKYYPPEQHPEYQPQTPPRPGEEQPTAPQAAVQPQARAPGPGWWLAADGRYYPPEQHPEYQRQGAPQAAPGWQAAAQPDTAPYQTVAPYQAVGMQGSGGKTSASGETTMYIAGLVSAIAVVVGALLPWVSVSTAFGTLSVSGTEGDGVLTIGGAVVAGALLLFGRGRKWAAVIAAVVGVIVTIIGVYDLANVSSAAADLTTDFARGSAGIGLWLTVVAGIALTGCSVVAAARS